jgi:hypothetical protein
VGCSDAMEQRVPPGLNSEGTLVSAVVQLGEQPARVPAMASRSTTVTSGRPGPDAAVAPSATSKSEAQALLPDRAAPTDPPVRLDRRAPDGMPPGRVRTSTRGVGAPPLLSEVGTKRVGNREHQRRGDRRCCSHADDGNDRV